MPKQKVHKGLKKRVKITASGKVKRRKAFSGHLMSSKNAKRRRRLSEPTLLSKSFTKTAKIMLGE